MKLGTIHLWGESLEAFRSDVRLAEELGYDVIGIGDSPAAWHDLYASLTIAAQETTRATLAPMVTGPFIRHPLVTANAMSTLDELSGGRAKLGFAAGGSLAFAVGRGLAKLDETRAYVSALRDLMAGRPATYEGRPVSPLRHARETPIYLSALGPKTLRLAGEIADGVIMFNGSDLNLLDEKLAIVRAGAEAAGRDPKEVDVWVCGYTSIGENRAKAIEDIKAFLVVNGMALRSPEALARAPAQFRGKIDELHRRYDPTEHTVVGGKNVALMDELGLTEYLAHIDTVAGTAEEVKAILDGFEARGVSTFFLPLPGHADVAGVMRRLAQAMGK
jgi:alkanesulfonate monooxygenase SsuD/methylene tetrahydromethanopterin reductase-like flavin-dependent oxidoreductase (luciferase family)